MSQSILLSRVTVLVCVESPLLAPLSVSSFKKELTQEPIEILILSMLGLATLVYQINVSFVLHFSLQRGLLKK